MWPLRGTNRHAPLLGIELQATLPSVRPHNHSNREENPARRGVIVATGGSDLLNESCRYFTRERRWFGQSASRHRPRRRRVSFAVDRFP